MKNDIDAEKDPTEIVTKLVSRYIPSKPRRISLKLYWNDKRSLISVKGDNLDQTAEYFHAIDFTSFANGVLEAYREAYGELKARARLCCMILININGILFINKKHIESLTSFTSGVSKRHN